MRGYVRSTPICSWNVKTTTVLIVRVVVEIGKIVTLTVLECDLGIIAGSMPMLRILFRSLLPSYGSSNETPGRSHDVNLVTIGGTAGRRTHMTGAHRLEDYQDNQVLDKDSSGDNESTRCIIRITHEVEQDSSSVQGLPANQFQADVSGSKNREH